ncbi:alpha/beta hydrolase [Vibrio aquaticus]|uniref:Alpha/beta hydrolase n=1 Tax=Vibrio aquaticus TaxID=2496559 RepID=A0A3S0P7Y2_9VIBR|nr:alpha/beta hydrolase [Vibrio aquaticus]RTZ17280.1 alpha/beta hydrolase [Vibrio aquaticus]
MSHRQVNSSRHPPSNVWRNMILIPLLLFFSSNVASQECQPSDQLAELLLGNGNVKIIDQDESPFALANSTEQRDMVLWLTNEPIGAVKIEAQGKTPLTVVALPCQAATVELQQALIATRSIVGNSIALSDRSHFMNDLGLSFDQIVQIQHHAFELVGKQQPDALYETIGELATYLASTPKHLSRSVSEKPFHIQTVYYATTRSVETEQQGVFYNGDRDIQTPLHVGKANVSIPRNHQKGQIEQPLLSLKWLKQADSHVLIQSVNELSLDDYWQSLPIESGKGQWQDSVIIYVHGYNVAFQSAIKRTAQMAYDFDFSGVPILFSWPSNASLLDYASDREDAIWSATYFAQFLTQLKGQHPNANIHVVAHSMGNQVLLNGLNELALRNPNKTLFKSIILAAPDVDSQWFTYQIAPRILTLASNWAVYTSENDGALIASEKVNQAKRLGMPVSLAEGVDVIDTSGLNAAPWSIPESHSYYANKLPVIEDLVSHLRGIPPEKRALIEANTQQGNYWQLIEDE